MGKKGVIIKKMNMVKKKRRRSDVTKGEEEEKTKTKDSPANRSKQTFFKFMFKLRSWHCAPLYCTHYCTLYSPPTQKWHPRRPHSYHST